MVCVKEFPIAPVAETMPVTESIVIPEITGESEYRFAPVPLVAENAVELNGIP